MVMDSYFFAIASISEQGQQEPSWPPSQISKCHVKSYLNARVSNGTSTKLVERIASIPGIFRKQEGFSDKHSLVSILVHTDGKSRDLPFFQGCTPVSGKVGDGGGKARS